MEDNSQDRISIREAAAMAGLHKSDAFRLLTKHGLIVYESGEMCLTTKGIQLGGTYAQGIDGSPIRWIVWPAEKIKDLLVDLNKAPERESIYIPRIDPIPYSCTDFAEGEIVVARRFVINRNGKSHPVYLRAETTAVHKNGLVLAIKNDFFPKPEKVLFQNIIKVDHFLELANEDVIGWIPADSFKSKEEWMVSRKMQAIKNETMELIESYDYKGRDHNTSSAHFFKTNSGFLAIVLDGEDERVIDVAHSILGELRNNSVVVVYETQGGIWMYTDRKIHPSKYQILKNSAEKSSNDHGDYWNPHIYFIGDILFRERYARWEESPWLEEISEYVSILNQKSIAKHSEIHLSKLNGPWSKRCIEEDVESPGAYSSEDLQDWASMFNTPSSDSKEICKMFILYDFRAKDGDTDSALYSEIAESEEGARQIGSIVEEWESGDGIWYEYDVIKVDGQETLVNERARPDIPAHKNDPGSNEVDDEACRRWKHGPYI